MSLPSEVQASLKDFIFQRIYNAYGQTSKLVFNQLCISGALISIFLLTSSWSNFFEDLFIFMNTSNQNLMAGLEILEAFACELDQVVIEKKKSIKIRCLILEQMPQKFIDLFEFLLVNQSNDVSILEKSLYVLKAWTAIKLQILQYSLKIIDVLLRLFEESGSEERMELLTEIICDTIKFSVHADILESANMVYAEKLITINERTNINKIIEFLGVRHLERFMKEIKQENSTFSRCYTEILSILSEKFMIFILEVC